MRCAKCCPTIASVCVFRRWAAKAAGATSTRKKPIPRLRKIVLVVEIRLIEIRQEQNPPTVHRPTVFVGDVRRWKALINVVIVRDRERQTFQVSLVRGFHGCVASTLHGRNQRGDAESDNGHDTDHKISGTRHEQSFRLMTRSAAQQQRTA